MIETFLASLIEPITLASAGIAIFKPLYWLFGVVMGFFMDIFSNNYFISIVLFTLLTRLILFPFNLRQQRNTAKTARLQPKIQKIQNRYKNSKDPKAQQKMQEEIQELYNREGHNPMQMGCGTMIFQMVFLMGIVGIIYYPLSYVLGISEIADLTTELTELVETLGYDGNYLQLGILENWSSYKEALMEAYPEIFTETVSAEIEAYREGMYLFGLDMTAVPHWADGVIVVVPLLSFATSAGSTAISMIIQRKNNPAAATQSKGQTIMMSIMMPLFSLYIAFQVPAAVGFYWIISNCVAIIQQLFIAKAFPPRKTQAKLMVENTIVRRSREESIKKTKLKD